MTDTEGRDVEPEASTSTSSATAGATPAAAAAAMDVVVTETGSSEAAAALDQQEGTASTISTTTAAPSSKAPAKKKGGQEVDPRRSHIQLDHYVMFQLPSKNIKLLRLTPDMQVINLGKCGSFPAPELIGKPYGVTFEVVPPVLKDEDGNVMEVDAVDNDDGGRKRKSQQQQQQTSKEHRKKQKGKASAAAAGSKVPPPLTDPAGYGEDWSTATSEQQTPLSTLKQLQGLALEAIEDPGSTNENILATGAKTLSHEEIDEMKKRGMSGRDIIERQIAEHEQFALKNEYSKAKYKSRKEAKFLKYFTPLAPTIHNVCQYFFKHDPKKIRDLRPDTLAQILALGNVRPGSRVVVVDETSGLLVGALAERMGGQGQILLLHQHDSPPNTNIAPLLNLPASYMGRNLLKSLHWGWTDDDWVSADQYFEEEAEKESAAAAAGTSGTARVPEGETSTMAAEVPADPTSTTPSTATNADLSTNAEAKIEREKSKVRKKREAKRHLEEIVTEYRSGEYDALIVSSQFEPLSIIRKLLKTLGGSAQIVVHSPTIQPLSDAVKALMNSATVLNPTIVEPWLRQYQVLPGRTHPEMNGTAHGGYIMHATRIIDEGIVSNASASRKKRGKR